MTKLDTKHHLEGESIVKTSNGQKIDLVEEPVILFRARDHLAVKVLEHYRELCLDDKCTVEQLLSLETMIDRFEQFRRNHPEAMKQPGITKGK